MLLRISSFTFVIGTSDGKMNCGGSCREKSDVGKDEDTFSVSSRTRRRSMENLELVQLTPNKVS